MPRLQGPVGGERQPRRPRAVRVDINTWNARQIIKDAETPNASYAMKVLAIALKRHLTPWFPEYNS
jgi:hypothetical protein